MKPQQYAILQNLLAKGWDEKEARRYAHNICNKPKTRKARQKAKARAETFRRRQVTEDPYYKEFLRRTEEE